MFDSRGTIVHRLAMVIGAGLLASAAMAQEARVTIAAGVAAQPTATSFTSIATLPYFAETARTEATYRVGDGVAFEIGGRVRLGRRLVVGVAVTRATPEADSETRGSFPHPFFFRANRTGTWPASALDRSELGVHVSAVWPLLTARRWTAVAFGGPSLFRFKQSVITGVEVIESYPYDTIDARLVTGTVDGSAVGLHAGVDLGWFFMRHVGIGGLLRFARATKSVRLGDGEPFDLDMGGLQGGGGVRLRF